MYYPFAMILRLFDSFAAGGSGDGGSEPGKASLSSTLQGMVWRREWCVRGSRRCRFCMYGGRRCVRVRRSCRGIDSWRKAVVVACLPEKGEIGWFTPGRKFGERMAVLELLLRSRKCSSSPNGCWRSLLPCGLRYQYIYNTVHSAKSMQPLGSI